MNISFSLGTQLFYARPFIENIERNGQHRILLHVQAKGTYHPTANFRFIHFSTSTTLGGTTIIFGPCNSLMHAGIFMLKENIL